MIRLKQNKYPVVFLTQGVTAKYPMYHDTRCQTIPMAVRHALAADILGINVHTEDILRDPSQVKLVRNAGLIIFCWGDDNNDKDTIQHLKRLGLHGVIYDKYVLFFDCQIIFSNRNLVYITRHKERDQRSRILDRIKHH